MTLAEQKRRAVAEYFYDNPGDTLDAARDHLIEKFGGSIQQSEMGRIRRDVLKQTKFTLPGPGQRRTLTDERVAFTTRIKNENREYVSKLATERGKRSMGLMLDDIIEAYKKHVA